MIYLGFDIGGTDTKIGILDENANVLVQGSTPTNVGKPYPEIVRGMADYAVSLLQTIELTAEDVTSVGVGIPGIALSSTGVVVRCVNMNWENVPLRDELQKYFNCPIVLDNDANLAGLAESICGVSEGTNSSVFITLGTGVGSGLIFFGRPWSGHNGAGAELGHFTMDIDGIPCACGRKGCLERYCSATALIGLGKEATQKNPESQLWSACANDLDTLNGKMIFDCAKAGDPTALAVFDQYIHYLCIALSSIICLLDPQVIVLGGGISKAGAFLLDALKERIKAYLLFPGIPYADLKIATLGADAGFIGAAMLAKKAQEDLQ